MKPKIITSDDMLRHYMPNQIPVVKGEVSLFDKIATFIQSAEQWVFSTFISEADSEKLVDNPVYDHLRAIVANEALRKAVASLDLILTPNGFATVGSQNLAVASKPRVDRLIAQLVAERDDAICSFLSSVAAILPDWLSSVQGRYFSATLFPTPALADLVGVTTDRWEKWLSLRAAVIDIESSLAEEYFSTELMMTLRQQVAKGIVRPLAEAIRSQVVMCLQDKPINQRRMIDLVNFIRNRPDDFPEWHYSETAKLFRPPVFTNQKDAKGYWF